MLPAIQRKGVHFSFTAAIIMAQYFCCLLLSALIVIPFASTSERDRDGVLDDRSNKFVLRFRRETWKNDDLSVCDIFTDDDLLIITLTCDQLFKCKVDVFKRSYVPYVKPLPSINLLSDNCTDVFNPFISYGPRNKTFDKYYLTQNQIRELTLQFMYKTVFNPGYFCGLRNVISMTFRDVLYDMQNLGFSETCSLSACCVCNLKLLTIYFNSNLTVIRDSFFCGMQNLTTLILKNNKIAEIEKNAFLYLPSLERLEMQNNMLATLSNELFRTPKLSLKYVDISNNKLNNEMFYSLQNLSLLEDMELSNNNITGLNDNYLKGLTTLKRLNLYSNNIITLEGFQYLTSLEELDVSRNKISNVSDFYFNSLVNLSVLRLRGNHFSSIVDFISNENYKLNVLDISLNEFTTIPSSLKYLKNLTDLNLAQNKIDVITDEDQAILCNITNLQNLNLHHNNIQEITPGAFACNANLETLNLNYNKLKTITTMKFSKATHLYVRDNEINNILVQDLSPHLVHLDATHNVIREFHFDYGDSASGGGKRISPNLQFLNLYNNLIETFTISECSPTAVSVDTVTNKPTGKHTYAHCLPEIDLGKNFIKGVCPFILKIIQNRKMPSVNFKQNDLLCQCELRYLNDEYNMLMNTYRRKKNIELCKSLFPTENFEAIGASLRAWNLLEEFICSVRTSYDNHSLKDDCPCNLHPSYYKTCELPCPNNCNCFIAKRYDLYLINCSNMNLISLPNFEQLNYTVIVNFSGNQFSTLNASVMSPYTRAIRLDLGNNYLRNIAYKTFYNFEQLEILNLKNNLLSEIEYEMFLGLRRLKELDLSNNRLVNVHQGAFLALASVQNLTLRNNKLNEISTSELSNLKSLHVQGIDLASNPWSCDCDFALSFRGWLENSSSLVKEAETLYCLQNDSRISLITFNNSDCYYVQARIIRINDIATWTSVVSVVTFITVLTIVIYLYRKEMQVLIYSRYGIRLFQKKEDVDVNKTYDVFIAYSSLDEAFVVEHLLPGLEEIEKPYTVCIHHRNFMAGAIITESILEAIEVSSRTIVVLSENFVQSGFCRFEFKSAHLQMFIDKSTRIIVLLLGKIPSNLDPEMKLYLNTNTYLEWGDRLFWEKLYFALPDKKDTLV